MNIIIDNYDSFTYNLAQYIGEIDPDIKVYKNDSLSIDEIITLGPKHIIISPGPGRPEDAGISVEIIKNLKGQIPILGICLGHQAIGYAFGAAVINADDIFHGKVSNIFHDNDNIFRKIPSPFTATRYHSLIIKEASLSNDFNIIARTSNNLVMGIKHVKYPLYGLQFHPESILTDYGFQIIKNFLDEDNRQY
jgi:anthranilate synthase/aminodeoxychorismate synthase-like glutamine amidotransferase